MSRCVYYAGYVQDVQGRSRFETFQIEWWNNPTHLLAATSLSSVLAPMVAVNQDSEGDVQFLWSPSFVILQHGFLMATRPLYQVHSVSRHTLLPILLFSRFINYILYSHIRLQPPPPAHFTLSLVITKFCYNMCIYAYRTLRGHLVHEPLLKGHWHLHSFLILLKLNFGFMQWTF